MDRNEYYAIYFKDKLVAVITEKELADLKEDQKNIFNKDIKIKRIAENEIDKFSIKDVRKLLTKEERKKSNTSNKRRRASTSRYKICTIRMYRI